MNTSYSKWDAWAKDYDDNGEEKTNEVQKPKCVFGKPMTEEEFLKRNDKDVPVIHTPTN